MGTPEPHRPTRSPADEGGEVFRLLVQSVKDYAIFMLDEAGRISTWNTGAEAINGYRAEEVLGKHFSMLYPPADVAAGSPERELRLATETGRYVEEGWRVRKNGEQFWASVVLTAMFDPATGKLRGFAKVTRDLTERRRMEQEARAAAEATERERARALAAQSALRSRDEFISVAAHELRTPLTALSLTVEGAVHALRKAGAQPVPNGGHTPTIVERLERALRQIGRLTELVDRLLDVSRIVQGKLAMKPEELDLVALTSQIVEDFREPAAHAGSELIFHGERNLLGFWDRARLEQVVINLVANAIKYGGGKPIDVRVEATRMGARLVVADRGIGIAPEDVDRIFTRFERAAPVRHYSGLGLGLYVTRNIVEAHGGSITVSSRPGEGATFTIDLPMQAAVLDHAAAHISG